MNTSKHTPGPWTRECVTALDGELMSCTVRGAGRVVAEIEPHDDCEPDARLIAAAPDLEAALRNLVAAVENSEADSVYELAAARAALAKAGAL